MKRLILIGISAIALAFVPAAAQAAAPPYPAPEDSLACSDTVVSIEAVFTCTVAGANGQTATLEASTAGADASFAGLTSQSKLISGNVAVFTVTAPSAVETIQFQAYITPSTTVADTASVAVIGEQTLSQGGFIGAALAATGLDSGPVAGASLAFIALGITALIFARKRRRRDA